MRKKYILPIIGIIIGLALLSVPTVALGNTAISWLNQSTENTGPFTEFEEEVSGEISYLTINGSNIRNINISFNDADQTTISGNGDLSNYTAMLAGTELIITTSVKPWDNSIFFFGSIETKFEFDTLNISLPKSFMNGKIHIETFVSNVSVSGNDTNIIREIDVESLSTKIVLNNINTQLEVKAGDLELETTQSSGMWDLEAARIKLTADEVSKPLDLEYNSLKFDGLIKEAVPASYRINLSGFSLNLNDKSDNKRAFGNINYKTDGDNTNHITIRGEAFSQRLTIR